MRWAALTVAAVSLGAALVVSRPLPGEISRGLPVGARQLAELPVLTRVSADTLQLYYQLWLVRDGLLGPTPLFTDPYQFRVNSPRWNLPQAFLPLSVPFTVPRTAVLEFPCTYHGSVGVWFDRLRVERLEGPA